MIKLQLQTDLHPTEDRAIIADLFNKFYTFSQIDLSEPNDRGVSVLSAQAEGPTALDFLFQQVRQQRTVEAVRRHVIHRMDLNHNSSTFFLHKQALAVNRIVLCHSADESPLGPIIVTISANDIQALIDYLFPPTKEGKVLEAEFSIDHL